MCLSEGKNYFFQGLTALFGMLPISRPLMMPLSNEGVNFP